MQFISTDISIEFDLECGAETVLTFLLFQTCCTLFFNWLLLLPVCMHRSFKKNQVISLTLFPRFALILLSWPSETFLTDAVRHATASWGSVNPGWRFTRTQMTTDQTPIPGWSLSTTLVVKSLSQNLATRRSSRNAWWSDTFCMGNRKAQFLVFYALLSVWALKPEVSALAEVSYRWFLPSDHALPLLRVDKLWSLVLAPWTCNKCNAMKLLFIAGVAVANNDR